MTCQFRGREVSHAYLGRDLLIRFAEQVGDHGIVERQPLLEGKSMSLVIASTHKPKTPQPQPQHRREDGAPDARDSDASGEAPAPAANTPVAPAESPAVPAGG